MAHYAFLDQNNIVTEVITGRNEDEIVDGISDWESWYGEFRGQVCKRTSYSGSYRKNYAGLGYYFNEELDAFIAPQPHLSWTLNEETCQWESPKQYPKDGKFYLWNENHKDWEEVV